MFLQNLRAKIGARLSGQGESGFTLIELLVVMLILGILAAIALPAFFNQKSKAGDAKAKETIHSVQVAMETCATETPGGVYDNCSQTKLEAIEPALTGQKFTVSTTTTPAGGYIIKAQGAVGNFELERKASGELVYTCEKGGEGGCSGTKGAAGTWGEG